MILLAAIRPLGEAGVKILAQSVESDPGVVDAMLLAMEWPDKDAGQGYAQRGEKHHDEKDVASLG